MAGTVAGGVTMRAVVGAGGEAAAGGEGAPGGAAGREERGRRRRRRRRRGGRGGEGGGAFGDGPRPAAPSGEGTSARPAEAPRYSETGAGEGGAGADPG